MYSTGTMVALMLTILLSIALIAVMNLINDIKNAEIKIEKQKITIDELSEEALFMSKLSNSFVSMLDVSAYYNFDTREYMVLSSSTQSARNMMEAFLESYSKEDRRWLDVFYGEDKERAERIINRKVIFDTLGRGDNLEANFRMVIAGVPKLCRVWAVDARTKSGDVVFGVRIADDSVEQDRARIFALENDLQRMRVYQEAAFDQCSCHFEADITDNTIAGNISYKNRNSGNLESIFDSLVPRSVTSFDELMLWWGNNMVTSDRNAFLSKCNCKYLLSAYDEGMRAECVIVESNVFSDDVLFLKVTFYLGRRLSDGHITSLCVIEDLTDSIVQQSEILMLKTELRDASIRMSASQMRPHFLYNALSSIREIILEDPELASDLVYDFTQHLRACIKSMGSNSLVSIWQEIENTKAYVRIEQMRLSNKLIANFDIDENADFDIVPLSIQPLVENSIRHGIFKTPKGAGAVSVSIRCNESFWFVTVEDNGCGFDVDEYLKAVNSGEIDSTGIKNMSLRVKELMNADFEIKSEIGVGTVATIIVPK